jgi:thiamine biosynthesis lipoprotein ApbE
VSVVAPTTVEAEVFAKAALIAGIAEGSELLEERGLGGLFVLETGGVDTTPAWPDEERDWEA